MTDAFAALGVAPPILRALAKRGYETPTPIQEGAIPHLLDGADLLGIAQTGTGKTAAFAIPMLQILHEDDIRAQPKKPRALVLAPTRELALQIRDACVDYGKELKLKTALVFGGVGQTPQIRALAAGVDILIATPGRLLDLMQQGHCKLNDIDILVLDEADRMLDMGFLPDVRRILQKVPRDRQTLLFSATMPSDIDALAKRILDDPERVEVTPPAATADRIEQCVYHVQKAKKRELLVQLLDDPAFVRTLVFTRTKHGADRVVRHLTKAKIPSFAIHGNKSQSARERALEAFRQGKAGVLVATDIAARGIDIKEISHVVNFDLPNVPESYVHRIGRTARAGRSGLAISFCDESEHEYLRDIEKLIKQRIQTRRKQDLQRGGRDQQELVTTADAEETAAADDRPQRNARGRQRPDPRHAPGPYANSDEVRRPRTANQPSEGRRRKGEARPGGRGPGPGQKAGGKKKAGKRPGGGSGDRSRGGKRPKARGRRG